MRQAVSAMINSPSTEAPDQIYLSAQIRSKARHGGGDNWDIRDSSRDRWRCRRSPDLGQKTTQWLVQTCC